MSDQGEKLAQEIGKIRQDVEQLRDEVRVRIHLGAMDARDAFATVEHDLKHIGRELTQATREQLVDAPKRLEKVRAGFEAPKTTKPV